MWTPSEITKLFRALAVLALLGLPVLDGAVPAQTSPSATAAPESRQELRQLLERRYEVLPIRNGVLLRPRQERLGVRTIELSGDTVAINGERVSNGVLRAWLGEDADPVLRLQAMAPAERSALFGMDQAGEAAPAPVDEDAEPEEVPEPAMDTAAGVPAVPEAPEAPPPPPALEEDGEEEREELATRVGSQVNVGGPITVGRGEIAEEAVAVLGPVRVDGEVVQDAVAVLGAARINGRVGGEVVAVMGSVILGPDAEVMGNVTSVGGNVRRSPGSRIHGSVSEVTLGASGWHGDVDFGPFSPFDGASRFMDLFGSILGTLVLALLVCLVLLVARQPLERVEAQLAAEPWKAALAGLAAVFLSVPLLVMVSILLIVTIVGCALFLLYPFLFLAIALLALLGYAAAAYRLGRWLEVRFNRRFGGPYAVALIGVLAIQIWSILGRLIGLPGGPLGFFAAMLVLFGGAVQVVAWVMGFGAVLLARLGAGPRPWRPGAVAPMAPMAPVPPPAPVYHPGAPASYPAEPAVYPTAPTDPTDPTDPTAPADPSDPHYPEAGPLPEAWEGPRGTGGGGGTSGGTGGGTGGGT